MSKRREALREYLTEVARDLVARGIVRRGRGQSLEGILKAESSVVIREVQDDLVSIGRELGMGLAVVAKQFVEQHVASVIGQGAGWIAEMLSGKKR